MIDFRTVQTARLLFRLGHDLREAALVLRIPAADLDRALWHWIGQK